MSPLTFWHDISCASGKLVLMFLLVSRTKSTVSKVLDFKCSFSYKNTHCLPSKSLKEMSEREQKYFIISKSRNTQPFGVIPSISICTFK